MEVRCPKCGDQDRLPDAMKGRKLKCGKCGATFAAGVQERKSARAVPKHALFLAVVGLCILGAFAGFLGLKAKEWTPDEVLRLTDQATLVQIVAEEKDSALRSAAVENPNLTDQALLAKLAAVDEDPGIRLAATTKLSDPAVLAKMATMETDPKIRTAAVKNPSLTDQALLSKLAMEKGEPTVRAAAVLKLTDQALITKLVLEEEEPTVHAAAVMRQVAK